MLKHLFLRPEIISRLIFSYSDGKGYYVQGSIAVGQGGRIVYLRAEVEPSGMSLREYLNVSKFPV